MARDLPSMSSLRAFEAVARHKSFTRAATELHLTQSAISQRIKALEDLIGVRLFERDKNTVELNAHGRDYLEAARSAITQLLVATDRAVERQRHDVLTIGCLGTFAQKCLIPNLPSFRARHPEIALRIRTLVPFNTLAHQDYDVSIQYGSEGWEGFNARRLTREQVFPVCSPALATRDRRLRRPTQLRRHTCIKTASPLILRDDWPLWLEAAGVPNIRFDDELMCDLLYPSFQAAIEGLGIAMGRSTVVKCDMERGLLVAPFNVRISSPLGYFLLASPERAKLAKVSKFSEWICECFRSDLECLR